MSTIGFILGIILTVAWACRILNGMFADDDRIPTEEPLWWVFTTIMLTAWIWMSWLCVGLGMIPWAKVLPSDTFSERIITSYDPAGAPRQKHRPGVE